MVAFGLALDVFLLTPLREGRRSKTGRCICRVCNFYSRPCGRGDDIASVSISGNIVFLLTPLREGRPRPPSLLPRRFNFYSRPCGRGDKITHFVIFSRFQFLLTPLREGRLKSNYMASAAWLFLLTPLREGRPENCLWPSAYKSISTHAPAGGATSLSALSDTKIPEISTHAPAGGATEASDE